MAGISTVSFVGAALVTASYSMAGIADMEAAGAAKISSAFSMAGVASTDFHAFIVPPGPPPTQSQLSYVGAPRGTTIDAYVINRNFALIEKDIAAIALFAGIPNLPSPIFSVVFALSSYNPSMPRIMSNFQTVKRDLATIINAIGASMAITQAPYFTEPSADYVYGRLDLNRLQYNFNSVSADIAAILAYL